MLSAVTESEGGADDEAIEEVVHPVADHDRAHDTRLLGRVTGDMNGIGGVCHPHLIARCIYYVRCVCSSRALASRTIGLARMVVATEWRHRNVD